MLPVDVRIEHPSLKTHPNERLYDSRASSDRISAPVSATLGRGE
jgi:hypothetical protein